MVVDPEKNRINIVVQGPDRSRRSYFTIIWDHIRKINGRFDNLQVTEYIPLPGYPDERVEFEELLGYERAGRNEYFSGKLQQTFSVSELLDSVISREDRQKEQNDMGVNIQFSPTIQVSPSFQQTNTQHVEVTVHHELRQNIEELRGKFINLKQEILDEAEQEYDDDKERSRLGKELDRVEEAIVEMEQAATSQQQPRLGTAVKDRLERFMASVVDENSRLNKLLKGVSKGVERAQTVADLYHKCATLFGSIPMP